MTTQYPPPEPAAFALLKKAPALASPGQQAILAEFAAGNIGIETTVYQLMQEVRKRFPDLKAAREAAAYERATRARELREMEENEKAAGPTFVEYTPEGRPVNEQPLLPAGSLVATAAVAVAKEAEPTTAAETVPSDESRPVETEESATEGAEEDDSGWVGESEEEEQLPELDD